jgi:hypothetical protein
MNKGWKEMVMSVVVRSMMTVVAVRFVVRRTRGTMRVVAIRTSLNVRVHLEVRLDVAWHSVGILTTTTATECMRHAGLEVGDLILGDRLPLAESSRKHTTILRRHTREGGGIENGLWGGSIDRDDHQRTVSTLEKLEIDSINGHGLRLQLADLVTDADNHVVESRDGLLVHAHCSRRDTKRGNLLGVVLDGCQGGRRVNLANSRLIECENVIYRVDLDSVQQKVLVVVVDGKVEEDILGAALDLENVISFL